MLRSEKRILAVIMLGLLIFTLSAFSGKKYYSFSDTDDIFSAPADTSDKDTLPYPFDDESGGLYLDNPSNYTEEVEYDPETGQYIVTKKVGGLVYGPPMFMEPNEYEDYVARKQIQDYWSNKTQSDEVAEAEGRDPNSSLIPQIQVNSELFSRIFGSNTIDIRPQGYAELRFGGRLQRIDNPAIPERNRSTFTFDFDQRIQMNVTGKIGEKLELSTNYDTEATFSFENQMKTEYTGDEDDIVKKIELGNVSLPLNSSLISGAQSLFGVKGQFQFGKLMLTGVFSEQRSQSSSINIQGGATTTDFTIWGDQYEANRHFFLSQFFRDNYEQYLSTPPNIISPVQITKVEVWVTNTRQITEDIRNIVAFMDLGERENNAYRNNSAGLPGPNIYDNATPQRFPDNRNNELNPNDLEGTYPGARDISLVNSELNNAGFEEAIEYTELANARKLRPSEFTFHPQLGYISLSTALNQDEVLAVAFQFTAGGRTFQVGEFSTDGVAPPKTLIVKMLKSTILNVKAPMWDLMMKNVYSLNAFQVNSEDFRLQILYQNDETGTPIPFLPDGNLKDELLLRVMDLDRLNNNNDPQPDGFFDFIPGITINSQNGRIIFPVLEPFGENLRDKLNDETSREKYVFQELYDSTRFVAQNETQLNKFLLRGQFKSSSSSEIQLNAFNIPEGSVTVTAGGVQLQENVQYTVDYNLGRVKIIDEGILNSGTPIRVDFENNALFSVQTKTFTGLNAEYTFNEHLNIGATMLHLSERPLTQKVNIGDEPISNMILGLNGTYTKEAPYLTRMVDAIPLIETKEKSNLTVQGEFAQLIPGSPRGIKIGGDETTYLDDFESSQTSIDIRNPNAWRLASTPEKQPDEFPEASINGIESGFNRAKLAWYSIDPLFHQSGSNTPDNIRENNDLQSGQYVRQVLVREVFPNLSLDNASVQNIPTLDLAFYPDERGPYNYDVEGIPGVSAGINEEGELLQPESRWGGVMRNLTTTNFEEQNIEFIQFWILFPYHEEEGHEGGDLYFNLGSISEDILKDGKQAIENGFPVDGDLTELDTTFWGYVPKVRPPVIAFDNDAAARARQDVGYDLLNDSEERNWKEDPSGQSYLERIEGQFGTASGAYQAANSDPSSDNFQYYRGNSLDQANADILQRYKDFNNPENNSNPEQIDGVSAFATNLPDIEDINQDQTLSKTEAYYQYRISLRQRDLGEVGQNYITDIYNIDELPEPLPNNTRPSARWIQFKIPVFTPDSRIGPITDFRSIRFIRMFLKGFSRPVVVRFARLELIRGEWRRYQFNLDATRDDFDSDNEDQTIFEVNAVNIEQNGNRVPIPYVLPPGIDRQILFGSTNAQQQNEQALSLRIIDLQDGSARAVFRNINFDMRMYKRLRMFAHAEAALETSVLNNGDVNLFIRMGSDYNQNYYEYEIPLQATPWNTDEPNLIWPSANEMDFALAELKDVKLERDRVYRGGGNSITEPYTVNKGRANITVVGAPNLSNVRTVMIGVRNPKKRRISDQGDDGLSKSVEVWVNELRLTEFDQRGGWAANARVAAKLADFANVSVSGRMSTVGFGSLDQSVTERQQEQIYAYDLQSSFELGKFFPKDYGLRIPMFFGTSEEWRNPQFNPLDPDIEFQDALNNLETDEEKQELREIAQDYTRRRSINFTNVRKERVAKEGKNNRRTPQVYDIENFSATYSFSEIFRRNISTVFDRRVDHMGSLNYSYQARPKAVEPFKNASWTRNKNLALIRDFNFYYYPRNFTVIGTINRSYNEMRMRNTDDPSIELPTTYNKTFTFNRQYSLLYDITKSLKLDYNARMNTWIDELDGPASADSNVAEIRDNLEDFGRPTQYHQTVNINWQVPVNKLPYLDFANVSARYTGDYDWSSNSLQVLEGPDSLNFGNTIQNNRNLQLNNNFNLVALYNKVPYLKKVNSGGQNQRGRRRERSLRRPGQSRKEGEDEKEEEEEEESFFDKLLAATARTLMMVKNASLTISESEGTLLPGFRPVPELMGMSSAGNSYAPGFWFTVGSQADIRDLARENNWLVTTNLQNQQYTKTFSNTINATTTIEPIDDLRIILTANRTYNENLTEFYRNINEDQTQPPVYESQNTFETRTFNISWYTLPTAFESLEGPEYSSATYEQFLKNREVVSRTLAEQYALENPNYVLEGPIGNPDSSDYGYRYFSYTSQDVLIPAFLAAYSGRDIEGYTTSVTRDIPIPNWQLTYDGLSKIKWVKEYLNNITINHSYRSTYSVGNMSTNLLYQQFQQDFAGQDTVGLNNNGDLLPEFQITNVTLSEQFAPLLGINMKLKNNMTIRVEYKKDRNVTLGLTNAQVTETKGTEWVVGTGYIIKDLKLKFVRLGPRRTNPVSNLEIRADLAIRDNITVIRRIVEGIDNVTAGQRIVNVKLSGDYQINTRVNAQLFYDLNLSRFKTTNAFPLTTHQFGISVRLNLGQ